MDSSQIEFDIGLGDDTGMAIQSSTHACDHPINFGNMCGVCGVYLSDEQIANSAPMTHDGDGVKVSTQEAKRLDTESTAHLLGQRKLALVIDLDQTIIHATVDRSVGEFMNDTSNPNHQVLKDVGKFFLGADGKEMRFEEEEEAEREHLNKEDQNENQETATSTSTSRKGKEKANGIDSESNSNSSTHSEQINSKKEKRKDQASISASMEARIRRATLEGGMWYYVKPRPHLNSFLETLSKKYQLHVYTMGTRSYADCVCKLIDRDGRFFGNRILSRDESGSIQRKSLARLFADTSMVVAIDDRADVWEYSPNLVKVVPFSFFPATGDINGAFLPPVPEAPAGAPSTLSSQNEASQLPDSLSSNSSNVSSSSTPSSPATSSTSLGEEIPSLPSLDVAIQDTETAKQVQTQQIALNEQRENRPLARMQQAKDEKLKNEVGSSVETSSSSSKSSQSEKEKSQDTIVDSQQEKSKAGNSDSEDEKKEGIESQGGKDMEIEEEEEEDDDETMSSDSLITPVVNLNDIAATTRAVLSDDDRELDRLEKILIEVHSRWYLEWDSVESSRASGEKSNPTEQEMLEAAMRPKPKVEDIIGSLKAVVLRGCGIVFSSMWPLETDPVNTEVWRMAEDFGAKCYLELNKAVTHVVAAKELTEKVKLGQRHKSIHVVWPTWFNESIASWSKVPEQDYLLPIPFEISNNKRTPSPLPEPPLISATEEAEDRLIMAALAAEQEAGDPFSFEIEGVGGEKIQNANGEEAEAEGMAGFAWDEAADEVDAFLSDDDDDEDTDGGYGTDASNRSRTKGKSVKRARNSTGGSGASPNGNHSRSTSGASTDNDEENGSTSHDKSPLSKRRRLAKSRSGLSKLKESETIHSGNDSEENAEEKNPRRRKLVDGNQTGSEFGDEDTMGEDQIAASQDTDGSEMDQSFLRQLEDDLELELGEDGGEE